MATKAELETELARLRKELAEGKASVTEKEAVLDTDEATAEAENASEAFEGGDLEGLFSQLLNDLETLPNRKPVLTALGIFFVGYLFGRSGHRG